MTCSDMGFDGPLDWLAEYVWCSLEGIVTALWPTIFLLVVVCLLSGMAIGIIASIADSFWWSDFTTWWKDRKS